MNRFTRFSLKMRALTRKAGSMLLLFQRSPVVQMLFPEARVLGGAGFNEIAGWTIATVAGLGAYDTVAGATTIAQTSPHAGATNVNAAVGTPLVFLLQCTAPSAPAHWTTTTPLPGGLTHTNSTNSTTDSITGTPTATGTFNVTVTAWESSGLTGNSVSKAFTITVAPAIISTNPSSVTIASGASTTLNVVATGSPLTYQWHSGTPPSGPTISGATSASFTTPNLTTATSYWVAVTQGTTTTTTNPVVANSTTATVSISVAPGITTQPASTTINSGATATLSVAASGSPAPTYQWYAGASGVTTNPVSGATSASFTTPTLTTTTTYWVRATNASGTADSNAATVTVNQPVAISVQPVSTAINSGSTATLSVTATGTAPLTYQWYQGISGVTTTPVGTNSSSFTTPALSTTTSYWVKVTNVANASGANSTTTVVSINQPAAISTQPAATTINSGGTATLSVTATGTAPLTYQWYQGTSGVTTTPVGTNSASFTTPALSSDTSYWVKVTNVANTSGAFSNAALVTVNQPAVVATPPASVTINSGSTTTLGVTASGTGPFTYQWYQGASGVTTTTVGTNSASFTTPALMATTSYWVKITNAANPTGANSAAATVNVVETFSDWQTAQFTQQQLQNASFSGPTADPDGDGITNQNEYILGLSPTTSNPSPGPTVSKSGNQITLGFTAKAAAGAGYAGTTRHYSLESRDQFGTGTWTAVPGYEDIVATGQPISYSTTISAQKRFYHLRVWLTP